MSAQIIEENGKAAFAVVPIDEYNLLLEKAEELDDVTTFDKAMHGLEVGQDELVPAEIAKQMVSGKAKRVR